MGINVHEIYFKKLSMTWLDKVYEQYRSSNMRVRSLKVGGVGICGVWKVLKTATI